MKTDMKMVLFTDGTLATLDGPDGWGKVASQAPSNVIIEFVVSRAGEA